MVTSNKLPDKKVVKMAEQNNSAVVPQRTLLGEVNEHITCPLCRGYYIDATTIVECLHSFCRSCIIKHLQVKSYCPVCEMLINSAKPNIKLDKALQDIVYKLVPGLFQKEMERRQQFYSSRPGPAASATPEQRGEDTERIIFSPEDVISFSLEFADATDTDSISSKSSDSNEPQPTSATMRRYLQCPAVVNINHLKKFLSMKFDIDSTQFAIDILYKRVPLPDYYTLMDIAYIYNWKRNEPMRFFYQIIDYVAIRNRLFDINKKGSHFRDIRSSPARTEDTSTSSPAPNLNDHGSEASSGTDSPMPEDNNIKPCDTSKKTIKAASQSKENNSQDNTNVNKNSCPSPAKKNDDEVEKSQFLNSFELTAKNNCLPTKSSPGKPNASPGKPNASPGKPNVSEGVTPSKEVAPKAQSSIPKAEETTLKRKQQLPPHTPELKKLKIELEKAKIPSVKLKTTDIPSVMQPPTSIPKTVSPLKLQLPRSEPHASNVKSEPTTPKPAPSTVQKMVSPLKLHIPKPEVQAGSPKPGEIHKPPVKKIPDLKPSVPSSQPSQNKTPPVNKVRMDLLANNSDPTKDRSKILSQVKTSLGVQSAGQTSGDPLKSLFDSCKIPSSLSITLTDQKLDARSPGDPMGTDQKKTMVNKNLAGASNNSAHKVPSPPVHNYIEILKLPDTDPKKGKPDGNNDVKPSPSNKPESNTTPSKPPNKSSETSTKGPIPNLKPIADTKLGKQSGNFSSPITFQQTFEKQIQSMQTDKKSKAPKSKAQVPKLVPATPKSFNVANKPSNNPTNKPTTSGIMPMEHKPSAALDLSTPHNIQTKMTNQQQTLETMQSIANLAKKFIPSKGMPQTLAQNNIFSGMVNTSLPAGGSPLRVPSASSINQMKMDKGPPGGPQFSGSRQDFHNKTGTMKGNSTGNPKMTSPSYQNVHHAQSPAQPSPRLQTRSPSSSPKLVIAEEKQSSSSSDHSANQSNQISSSHLSSMGMQKSESPKSTPGPSMSSMKQDKPMIAKSNVTGIRQPITPLKSSPPISSTDFMPQPHILAHQALLRQMELHKYQNRFDFLKNMTNLAHQAQNDFNNKDKQ